MSASATSPAGFDGTDPRYRAVLWIVIALNGLMFAVETLAGHLAGSQALKADALDRRHAHLWPVARRHRQAAAGPVGGGPRQGCEPARHRLDPGRCARAARRVHGHRRFLALAANLASVLLLARYKDGDANVRSVWLCSRNDAVGNVIVMIAAGLVWWLASPWPDLAVAFVMAGLFLHSATLTGLGRMAQRRRIDHDGHRH